MGLLDFLGSDDAKLGLGLLAAGGPSATPLSTWQRVQGAMQGLDADKQRKLQLDLAQSQIDENKQQGMLRAQQLAMAQRKLALDEQFMGGGLLGAAPSGLGATAAPAQAGPGGMAAPPQSGAAPAAGGGGFNAQAISQKYGVPLEAVISDFRFNGGKKIAELIAKRAEPNWVNVNGNLVNTNAEGFQGGVQGGVAAGNDGRVTQWQPDGKGGLVVGAPRGALDTYAAYQGISNRSGADYTPERVIDPTTGQTVVRPRSQVLQPAAGGAPAGYATEPQMRTTVAGDMGADPMAIARELRQVDNDLMKPLDEGSRTALKAYKADLQRQQKNLGPAPMAGNVVELSPAEQAANKARETSLVDTAKADVGRETSAKADAKTATKFLDIAKKVEDVFKMGPTDSGIGSTVDATAAFFGKSTKGAEAAQRLKGLGGWLVANVPRMEGPQSNFDVANYQVMAADVANDKLPLARRKAALDSITSMMRPIAEGQPAAGAGETAAPKQKTVVKTGLYQGKKVVQYSDGSVEYAN